MNFISKNALSASFNLGNSFSENCVYENGSNSLIPKLVNLDLNNSEINNNINTTIIERKVEDDVESYPVIHCKNTVEFKWIINATKYQGDIFESGIEGIGFRLRSNNGSLRVEGNNLIVNKPYIDNCPYLTKNDSYPFRYCASSWNGLYIELIKIGEIKWNNKEIIRNNVISGYFDNQKYNNISFKIRVPKANSCQLIIPEEEIKLDSIDIKDLSYTSLSKERHFSIDIHCKNPSTPSIKIEAPDFYKIVNNNILKLTNNKLDSGVGLIFINNNNYYTLGDWIKSQKLDNKYNHTFNFSVGYIRTNKKVLTGNMSSSATVTMKYQ